MAGGTTLPIDVQRLTFAFFPRNTPAEAEATLMLPTGLGLSAVDLTRTYHHASAYPTGRQTCQGVFPFDGSTGSSCSAIAVPPAPGPVGVAGDLGIINRGDIHQWRCSLTGPTTVVMERFGSPAPIPTPGCASVQIYYFVEYL